MKKALGWLVVAVLFLGVVLFAFLYVSVSERKQSIAGREPLTLEELDSIAKEVARPAAPEAAPATSKPEPGEITKVSTSPSLPEPLERTPSPEVLETRFASRGRKSTASRDAKFTKVFDGVLRSVGAGEDFTWQVGRVLMRAGEWEEARHYFHEALDERPNRFIFGEICAQLAWIETDPEKAARLLALSIDEEFNASRIGTQIVTIPGGGTVDAWAQTLRQRLENAVELCRATGSEALADYYLERLRNYDPEAASRFDEKSLEKVKTL